MIGSWARDVALFLAAAVIVGVSGPLDAHDVPMPREQASAPDAITQRVLDLGSPSFAVREQATHQLIDSGIVAREALAAASTSADAEVRMRARAILATISEADFRDRLEAFSADYDGSHKKTLPGWEQFTAVFGSGALARQMFVDMQRAEPDLLSAMVQGGRPASEALEAICSGHEYQQ